MRLVCSVDEIAFVNPARRLVVIVAGLAPDTELMYQF